MVSFLYKPFVREIMCIDAAIAVVLLPMLLSTFGSVVYASSDGDEGATSEGGCYNVGYLQLINEKEKK
ncbi:MAG: hypothetical protein ACRD8Z_01040 [Nitrososphaeraceae archaeon]